MPKTRISEYSTTNSDNTDIESININEGCAPSGINNAIRELMVHLKEWQSGAADTYNTPAGTVSAPAIAPTGDSNTGIFFPAADTIAFAEGGVESMRIDSSGNVLVGATSASYGSGSGVIIQRSGTATLRLSDATNSKVAELRADSTGVILSARGAYPIRFDQDDTERMRITSAGEVLVGGTTELGSVSGVLSVQRTDNTPSVLLYRNDTTVTAGNALGQVGFWGNDTTSNTPTQLAYIQGVASGTHAAGDNPTDLVFGTTPDGSATVAEKMRLTEAGSLLLGGITTNPGEAVLALSDVDPFSALAPVILGRCGSGTATLVSTASSTVSRTHIVFETSAATVGSITTLSSATAYNTSSDYRLKDNIASMTGALAKVAQLNPVTYTWKVDGSASQGFIAHELQEVIPEAVTGEKDAVDANGNPQYQGVDTSFLVATLTAAIKELKAELDTVKAELATLKG
jgi:hypothetical protein